jgi:putative transcriptional regulator
MERALPGVEQMILFGSRAREAADRGRWHTRDHTRFRGGALNTLGMRDMDRLCLPPRPDCGGPDVRRIRAATRMSQPVFARLLGVARSAVAQWERRAKRPSGPAPQLPKVLDPSRPDRPVVLVRRGMAESEA